MHGSGDKVTRSTREYVLSLQVTTGLLDMTVAAVGWVRVKADQRVLCVTVQNILHEPARDRVYIYMIPCPKFLRNQ